MGFTWLQDLHNSSIISIFLIHVKTLSLEINLCLKPQYWDEYCQQTQYLEKLKVTCEWRIHKSEAITTHLYQYIFQNYTWYALRRVLPWGNLFTNYADVASETQCRQYLLWSKQNKKKSNSINYDKKYRIHSFSNLI